MAPNDAVDEAELIRRAQLLNDSEAFGQLVRAHQSAVRTFLLRLCRDPHLCNDLAQDTFVLAFTKLDSYRPIGSFLGWLLKIAFRCFLQDRRRDKRRSALERRYSFEESHAKWYSAVSAEQLAVEYALQSLAADEAACISLCYTFGYSHSEATEILGLPLGTVKSHIHRGTARLADLLNSTESEKRP